MQRIILTYGIIAGLVVIASVILGLLLTGDAPHISVWLGYLIMLIALSSIFVAIKRYRDVELGGVIRFGTATLVGLGIAVVAGIMYVAVWELYLALTDYAFIDAYAEGIVAAKQAEGLRGAELQSVMDAMETLRAQYASPLFRLPMTFLEIFPVGLLITLLSAAVLRNPRVLPATQAA